MLDDMLGHVVPVLVGDEFWTLGVKLRKYEPALGFFHLFEQSLDDAAAIRVYRQDTDIAPESLNNLLDVVHRDSVNNLLDDVIAVLILDSLEHILFKLLDHGCLLLGEGVFQGLDPISFCSCLQPGKLTFWTTRQAYI